MHRTSNTISIALFLLTTRDVTNQTRRVLMNEFCAYKQRDFAALANSANESHNNADESR